MSASDPDQTEGPEDADSLSAGGFGRAAKGAVIVFALLVIAIILASWLGGDSSMLPLDYDGFD